MSLTHTCMKPYVLDWLMCETICIWPTGVWNYVWDSVVYETIWFCGYMGVYVFDPLVNETICLKTMGVRNCMFCGCLGAWNQMCETGVWNCKYWMHGCMKPYVIGAQMDETTCVGYMSVWNPRVAGYTRLYETVYNGMYKTMRTGSLRVWNCLYWTRKFMLQHVLNLWRHYCQYLTHECV